MKLEAIYSGRVRHARREPVEHRFEHPMLMVWIDLDATPDEPARVPDSWLWRFGGPALFGVDRGDYLPDSRGSSGSDRPLGDCVRELIALHTRKPAPARVFLLTQPRFCGFGMNPVSFYYGFDADRNAVAVVAEVTNTPWNESYRYVLELDAASPGPATRCVDKDFHVSPFMPLEQRYEFGIGAVGPSLELAIRSFARHDSVPLFAARLELEREEASPATLMRAARRLPFIPQRVFASIYLNALRLAIKGAAFHPHPAKRAPELEASP